MNEIIAACRNKKYFISNPKKQKTGKRRFRIIKKLGIVIPLIQLKITVFGFLFTTTFIIFSKKIDNFLPIVLVILSLCVG
jgi:hypothetical protein